MDKVCEKLREKLESLKTSFGFFIRHMEDGKLVEARMCTRPIEGEVDDTRFYLTGEKFVADLIAKKAVKLAYSGQPKSLGTTDEQKIREKIKVTSNKVLVDLRGVEDGILNLKAGATYLPDHLDVRGKLVLLDSDVTELPEFLNVTGNLLLNEKIKELPDNIRVGGKLILGTTAYQSMYDRAFELVDKGRIGGVG